SMGPNVAGGRRHIAGLIAALYRPGGAPALFEFFFEGREERKICSVGRVVEEGAVAGRGPDVVLRAQPDALEVHGVRARAGHRAPLRAAPAQERALVAGRPHVVAAAAPQAVEAVPGPAALRLDAGAVPVQDHAAGAGEEIGRA